MAAKTWAAPATCSPIWCRHVRPISAPCTCSRSRSGARAIAAPPEATARRLIALNKQSPWGYYALAEALQDRQQFQVIIDTLNPAVKDMRSGSNTQALALLLPHLGFAYEQLGEYDQAIAAFDEAHKIAPTDALITSYLIQANLSAKKYAAAQELAQTARAQNPDDLRLARLHAQALRQTGQPDRAVAVMQELLQKQADRPVAYVAMAQVYQDANRGADAVKVLDRRSRSFLPIFRFRSNWVPSSKSRNDTLTLRPPSARCSGTIPTTRRPRTISAICWPIAASGSTSRWRYFKKALQIDPENGSYLDSLGWAYFKGNKLDLADDNLKRAADQLKTNSVIQDHYADVLFKLGRYDEAIDAGRVRWPAMAIRSIGAGSTRRSDPPSKN